mgnify:CR=1 FL=1
MITDEFKTWEDAQKQLSMLTFDLGQSPKVIKEMFEQGYILVWNKRMNFYAWWSKEELGLK